MNKLVFALAAVFALSLFGCKKEEKPAETAKPTEPAKTEPAKTEPAKTEPAKTEPAKTEPAPAAGGDMPAECAEYAKKMAACLESDKFPAAAKEQTKTAFETMQKGWADMSAMPAEAKATAQKAAADACTQAMSGMKQAGEAMCPGVW